MYKVIIFSFMTVGLLNLQAQQYFTKTGIIKFFSHTSLEDIKAENRKVVSVLDSKTGAMEFSLLLKSFDFTNDLMEQHFNETYVESSKFPKATFKGRITDISKADFTRDGTYPVNYTGRLTIKDVTKDLSGTGHITIKDGKVTATSRIKIRPVDYNISIPATAAGKIADEIELDILMDYIKK